MFVSAADVDDFLRPQEFNVTRDGAVLGEQHQTGSLDKFNPDLNPQQVKRHERTKNTCINFDQLFHWRLDVSVHKTENLQKKIYIIIYENILNSLP